MVLSQLNRAVQNLHVGLDRDILSGKMRLIRIQALVAQWTQVTVYEHVTEADMMEVPYLDTDDQMWGSICTLSWRWAKPKPATLQAGASPMSDHQFACLKRLLTHAMNNGLEWVWIDWCCVPQYSGNPMPEIHRSRLFYGRARQLIVLPDFRPLQASPVLRLILHNAARHLAADSSSNSAQSGSIAAVLGGILESGTIASREYFGAWPPSVHLMDSPHPHHPTPSLCIPPARPNHRAPKSARIYYISAPRVRCQQPRNRDVFGWENNGHKSHVSLYPKTGCGPRLRPLNHFRWMSKMCRESVLLRLPVE